MHNCNEASFNIDFSNLKILRPYFNGLANLTCFVKIQVANAEDAVKQRMYCNKVLKSSIVMTQNSLAFAF